MTSHVEEPSNRKVWVVEVPDGDEYELGPVQVLIEQFGDAPPTLAFRRRRQGASWEQSVWGRPYGGEARRG